jgi:hypothetical protein
MNKAKVTGSAGCALLILGIIACFVSLYANMIEFGPFSPSPGFGFKQIIGVIAAVIFITGGGYLTFRSNRYI